MREVTGYIGQVIARGWAFLDRLRARLALAVLVLLVLFGVGIPTARGNVSPWLSVVVALVLLLVIVVAGAFGLHRDQEDRLQTVGEELRAAQGDADRGHDRDRVLALLMEQFKKGTGIKNHAEHQPSYPHADMLADMRRWNEETAVLLRQDVSEADAENFLSPPPLDPSVLGQVPPSRAHLLERHVAQHEELRRIIDRWRNGG